MAATTLSVAVYAVGPASIGLERNGFKLLRGRAGARISHVD